MALHYVIGREFRGKWVSPKFMVLGEEAGQTFRRVFRSRGLADRFATKVSALPSVRKVVVVELPKNKT